MKATMQWVSVSGSQYWQCATCGKRYTESAKSLAEKHTCDELRSLIGLADALENRVANPSLKPLAADMLDVETFKADLREALAQARAEGYEVGYERSLMAAREMVDGLDRLEGPITALNKLTEMLNRHRAFKVVRDERS